MKKKITGVVIAVFMVVLLQGCGGGTGSGGGQAGGATVRPKAVLAGTISVAVQGIDLTMTLPAGASVKADASGTVSSGVIALMPPNDSGSYSAAKYSPASRLLTISVIRGATPFSAGDFFSINCDLDAGGTTASMVFTVDQVRAFDKLGAEISPAPTASAGL